MKNHEMLDSLQQTVIADEQKKQANKKEKYHFDPLSLLFREDYEVNGIKISQPTIQDILTVGEEKFYQSLSLFLCNSTSIRLMLWESGIDWCNVKDIEVFSILSNLQKIKHENDFNAEINPLKILFKDIDILSFELYRTRQDENSDEEFFLYSNQHNITLSEKEYIKIAEYIREMFNTHPKVEKSKSKTAKKWMIDEDRMNLLHKDDKTTSTLFPLVSACINHPGFKYKLQELREIGIYQFMDSVQRLQVYESTTALLRGSYSGFCDTSKVPPENFNFMRGTH